MTVYVEDRFATARWVSRRVVCRRPSVNGILTVCLSETVDEREKRQAAPVYAATYPADVVRGSTPVAARGRDLDGRLWDEMPAAQ